MKSRWAINILLLVAIAILSLVAHFKPGIDQQPEAVPITHLKIDQLRRIHINRPVREDLVLLKNASGRWDIEHTPTLPTDSLQTNALLKLAEQKAVRSYPASELELSQLQLDPPYATVFLNDTAVEFGNLEPLEGLRYVRVTDRVHLIPDIYMQLIELSHTQFVRRRLFEKDTRITAITLPGLSISKADQNWNIEPAQEISADDLQTFIEHWQDATSLNIRAADPVEDTEVVVITLADNAGSIEFSIASREPELVLVRPDLGIQYRMGDTVSKLLALTPPVADEQE
jgi:hypothetical protein